MKQDEIQSELASIRSMMERSSKFISLSGLSGILAGVYALAGAAAAYRFIYSRISEIPPDFEHESAKAFFYDDDLHTAAIYLGLIALAVLIASLATGILLTVRKARQRNQPVWGNTSRALLFSMITPLFTGGLLILVFIYRGYFGVIAPLSLIFYGLSLFGAGNLTFTLVKYLGMCEIAVGLIAACFPRYGLMFWAIGFGVLHIVYGSVMYFKYDR